MTTQNTPKTDHVLQHGLSMTGKDELVYLSRQLERELAAIRAATEAETAQRIIAHFEQTPHAELWTPQVVNEIRALLTTGEKK